MRCLRAPPDSTAPTVPWATRYPHCVSEIAFPDGFLWGTATAAHQVEGNNTTSDWWAFELQPGTPCKEPSGTAIEHYTRYPSDMALLAGLGFNTYRFSVEWARIEPAEGEFDQAQLDHYRQMVEICRKSGLTPMVTLNHFTLPKWLADRGGWLSPSIAGFFQRFTRRVVTTFGDQAEWYCTLNEPGMVAFGGYAGGFPFPPGLTGIDNWKAATASLVEAHKLSRAEIKGMRPAAKVGLTNAMQEWESNAGGAPIMNFARGLMEDAYLEAAVDDDFIGVQTYTRARIDLPRAVGILANLALAVPPVEKLVVGRVISRQRHGGFASSTDPGVRTTQMGYEFRPQAVAATVRRAAQFLPGKPIVVTEHGIATADDAERVEFITDGLRSLHDVIADGIPLQGYIHWSAFDNFEWSSGYSMQFGLVAVDRTTQERTAKPSARFLGEIARANRLPLPK
jgi:beta-glucosidase